MRLTKSDQQKLLYLYESIGGIKAEAGFGNNYGNFKFSVNDLIEFSSNYKTENIPLATIQNTDAFKSIPTDAQQGSAERIQKADYSFPVILQVDKNKNVTGIGDGTHRIRAAIRDKKETIPAKLIPVEDWKRFEVKEL